MIVSSGATHALEIGGAYGYSAIWIGLGLRETGGHLTSIEYDPARARVAAANIRAAGLADIVTVVAGDAFGEIPKLAGDVRFRFPRRLEARLQRFFDSMLPAAAPRGLFLAHNVVNKQSRDARFPRAIQTDPGAVITTIVTPSGEGMSVLGEAGQMRKSGSNM